MKFRRGTGFGAEAGRFRNWVKGRPRWSLPGQHRFELWPCSMKLSLIAFAAAIIFPAGVVLGTGSDRQVIDHLVPVEKEQGLGALYEKLWQEKLLVRPGETARFVSLPGNFGQESAISIYQARNRKNALQGGYWITITQASGWLWKTIPQSGQKPSLDPSKVTIDRLDLPLPESTALEIHRVWLAMLRQTKPERISESISLDNSREIFSAVNSNGAELRGQLPTSRPRGNTLALFHLANSLIEYCNLTESERSAKAREIEKKALKLLSSISKR
jgi:hypothetical protein